MIYGYARVSTAQQARDGNSLEAQREFLKSAGAEVIYEEHISGTKINRPQLNELMKRIQSGDTLVATKLDRIARTASHGAELIRDLQRRDITVHILNMGKLDSSPAGKLTTQVLLVFAEFERDLVVERTAEGKAIAKLRPGFTEGRPRKFSDRQIEHALQLLSEGSSYTKVAELTGMSKSTLSRAKRAANKEKYNNI